MLRDVRITPIYEGTNGIQALDLVGRKLRGDGGAAMRTLLAEVATHPALAAAAAELLAATEFVLNADPDTVAASATAYLDACGWVLGGWMLARAAALEPAYAPLARFYIGRLMPRATASLAQLAQAASLHALLAA